MLDADLESFLSPLPGASPSGSDLEYDDAFRAMLEAGEDKPETQFGEKIYPARPPVWPDVREHALDLAARTRDLRVATWLTRSEVRLFGLVGYVSGLRLIEGLLVRHWPGLHPLLDTTDNDDPTARMNALTPLLSVKAGLGELRAATLTGRRGDLTVHAVELAVKPTEVVPVDPVVAAAVARATAGSPDLLAAIVSGPRVLRGIVAKLHAEVGVVATPEFAPLQKLLDKLAMAAGIASDVPVAAEVGAPAATAAPGSVVAGNAIAVGTIATRADAVQALDRVCEWLEQNEPSNPAPLLIRRSQRLMNKNFIEIIRDLAPGTLEEIEKLAGTERS